MASLNQKKLIELGIHILKIGVKHPPMLLFFLLFPATLFSYEIFVTRPALSFQGVPQAQNWLAPSTWARTLRSEAFLVGYSDIRGNALWVTYKIQPVPSNAKRLKRPSGFTPDWRSINKVTHKDYTRSGYDRGHLAPNYAISSLYGKTAQIETFVMTNITPQKPNLNRKLWQRLESVEIKHFTKLASTIWVATGPVFGEDNKKLSTASNIDLPEAFYKVYAMKQDNGEIKLLAFLMPQDVKGNESLSKYIVSVDTIEELTGLDFFHELDDKLEDNLEAMVNGKNWNLESVANIPSRY